MRAQSFQRQAPTLEARVEAQDREARLQSLQAKREGLVSVAWLTLQGLAGKDLARKGAHQTPVVALERRRDPDTGPYAIVGRVAISCSDRDAEPEVRFQIGTAFDSELAVAVPNEGRLSGKAPGEQAWYGAWQDEESTVVIDGYLRDIVNWDPTAPHRGYQQVSDVHAAAARKLNSLRESIEQLAEAASNPSLNPEFAERLTATT